MESGADVSKALLVTCTVAGFLLNTNRYHAAIKFYEEMLTLVNVIENVTLSLDPTNALLAMIDYARKEAFIDLAKAYWHAGSYKESKRNAERGLILSQRIGDKRGEELSYKMLSKVAVALYRYDKKVEYLEKALSVTRESGNAKLEAEIYYDLGESLFLLGQGEQALKFLEKSVEISRDCGHREMETLALFALASNWPEKPSESFQKLEEALKISVEIGDNSAKATTLLAMGKNCEGIGQYDKSEEYYQRSLQVSREIHHCENEGRAFLCLGELFLKLQKYDEAINYLEKALALCETSTSLGFILVKEDVCTALCRVYLKLGQQQKAREYRDQVLKSVTEDQVRIGPRWLTLCQLANCLDSNGETQQACDVFSRSIRYYESECEPLKEKFKLSLGNQVTSIVPYENQCRCLIRLGKFADALCTAERGRARVLQDLLAKKYAIQEKVTFLEDKVESLISELTKKQMLVFIATSLELTFFWVMTNEEGPKLELMDQKELSGSSAHDALTAALLGNSRSVADGRDIECEDRSLFALYDTDSSGSDEEIRVRLIESDEGDCDGTKTPKELYNMLIAPFSERIQGRELVLVPEGVIFMVPFASLQDDSGKYLSETCKIRIIPSLTTLKLICDSPADYHSQTGALIVGDPQVSHVTPLVPLPAARLEAQEIADLLKVTPLLGEQATKEEVLRQISDVCLIHIAAHGDAERGEIACAPNPSSPEVPRKEDYMLTMENIANVRIRAKLVVLSCCHSAKGEIMRAEGVVGIARAFIVAGARSVLVSLWAVDDKATKEFMILFYGHLVRGKVSASEALHQTMRWMRESKNYSAREWAPFVLIGDDVTLDL